MEYIATIYDTERIGVLNYTTEESQIISQVQADMITFANRRAAEWVMNGKIDEEWDAYLEELNRMNLEWLSAGCAECSGSFRRNRRLKTKKVPVYLSKLNMLTDSPFSLF